MHDRLDTYVELFLGGGAVLFFVLNKIGPECDFQNVYVNDSNPDLINAYRQVRNNVEPLIKELSQLRDEFRSQDGETGARAYYDARRDEYNNQKEHDGLRRAALLIFLNHTCYNGLYRVNGSGEFNVPYGKRQNVEIFSEEVLRADSMALKHVKKFMVGDFTKAAKYVEGLDILDRALVYLDPPYRPVSITSSFCSYTKDAFDDTKQMELASLFRNWDGEHAWVVESNSCTADDFYSVNYKGFHLKKVKASRMLNSNASRRGKIDEVVITNFALHGSDLLEKV